MLSDLLNIITPEALYHAIKSNPKVIELALHKFEACRSFGAALTTEQQVVISNNLDKVNDFFKSDQGKELLGILADDFVSFVNAK